MFLTWALRMVGHYYDGGHIRIVESKPGDVSAEFSQCDGCTSRVWQTLMAASEAGMAAAGAKAAQGQILRGGTGSDR